MTCNVQQQISKAMELIETARYRIGVSEFVEAFIETWSYQQSGLYPPAKHIPPDLTETAMELAALLSSTMLAAPTGDVLGILMSEVGFSKRGTNFYPTPPEIGQLMAELISGAETKSSKELQHYEPCCGSGINSLLWLEQQLLERGEAGVGDVSLSLEDIDRLMVRCAMLQLTHYLAARDVVIKSFSIVGIDSLSRATRGIAYYASREEAQEAFFAA